MEYKNREDIFTKAGEYLEKVYDELDNSENYSDELCAKILEDISDVDVIVREIAASWVSPDNMNKEKDEQLKNLIESNNRGELANEAIIKFLTDLYAFHGGDFSDFGKSWNESLNYIHKVSNNQELIDLVDDLFSNGIS